MSEKLAFTYDSIGSMVRLLTTIQYENSHTPAEIELYHAVFDGKDELFESFLEKLFEPGTSIDIEHVQQLVKHCEYYLETNEEAIDIKCKIDRRRYNSYVYFKPYNKVYPCGYTEHSGTVTNICKEYFKGADDIDADKLQRFILNNFEINSDKTSVAQVAEIKNVYWIAREIIMQR